FAQPGRHMVAMFVDDFLHQSYTVAPTLVAWIQDADAPPVWQRKRKYSTGPPSTRRHQEVAPVGLAESFECGVGIYETQANFDSKILGNQQLTVTNSRQAAKSDSHGFPMPCSRAERQEGHVSLVLLTFGKLLIS